MLLELSKIQAIKVYFQNRPVIKAYLFGSYARNEADVDSDIDLLVELDYSQQIGLKFIQMQPELEELLKNKVDLISINGLSEYMKPAIEKERMLIYER